MITIVVMGAQYAFLYGIDFLFAGENNYLAQLVSISYTALDVGLLIWIVVFLGICVIVFLIGRVLSGLILEHLEIKDSVVGLIRILLTCALFIGAIIYRGLLLISSGVVLLTDSTYYDAAVGLFTGGTPLGELAVHGASFAYVMILTFVMQFLGDRVVAVVILQIVIQVLTIMLTFSAFKRLVNYCTGFVAALILTISPLYTSRLYTSNPGCFVALLVIFVIWLVSIMMKIHGGVFKAVFGLVTGLITGYLIYMDVLCALVLIVWLFALLYEVGNEESENYLPAYLLFILGIVISAILSICLDGGFDPDGIDIAYRTWMKVTSAHIVPEYALIDPAQGVLCLIQCMIMVGVGAMTIMGTLGRRHIEYELPWIMMLISALTPMTKLGYLQDSTVSLIMYSMLTGAGISAMLHVNDEDDEEDEDDEDEDDDDDESGSEEVEIEYLNEDDSEPVEFEQLPDPVEKPQDKPRNKSVKDVSADTAANTSVDDADDDIETFDIGPQAPVNKNGIATEDSEDTEEQEGREELPTSIPWAEIKKLDEEDDDPMSILRDDEEDEEDGKKDGPAVQTVFSSANRNYDVVVEGEVFASEEVISKTDDYEDDYEEEFEDDKPLGKVEKAAVDLSTTQVDDLPGMIPNPLPLPPKKAQVEMDYDLYDDDPDDEDDLDWGKLDDDDIDDDDDFDI